MRRTFTVLLVGTAVALITGCSSSAGNNQPVPDPTFPAASAGTSPAATSTGGTGSAPTTPTSVAPAGSAALPGVPAVANATNLTVKPVPAAGTGTAPTELVIRDLVVGTGSAVDSSATVDLKYVGTLYADGTVFDTSWGKAGESPADESSFPLSGVIPGFAQGLVGMKVGGRREIVIPPALGYGTTASGPIPANSTIVFIVDMMTTTG
jgi:FKBP-type peptidyl-prolyl cis-trans isomerase